MSKAHHFPDLLTQEEIDADASVTLFSRCIQQYLGWTINVRNRLRRSWE